MHEFTAAPHQLRRFRSGERQRGDVRGVFAEGVPGRADGVRHLGADRREHRGTVREDRGLGVVGEGELFFRALEHDLREGDPQRVVDGLEGLTRGGKPFREILPHAHLLRALPGAEPDRAHQRTTMLAQVNPAPNATSMTVIPGFKRPVVTASSRAMATDAAEVLPKRSTFT